MASRFMTAGRPASNAAISSVAFATPISSESFGMPLKRADHGPRTRVGIFLTPIPRLRLMWAGRLSQRRHRLSDDMEKSWPEACLRLEDECRRDLPAKKENKGE
jgi:hypothetical protein